MKKVAKSGINFHNLYIQYFISNFTVKKYRCPNAEKFYKDSICLPIFYKIKNSTIKKIIKKLNEFKN